MAIGGAATCAKIMLIIANIVLALTGFLLLAIGIWLLADKSVMDLVGFIVSEQSILFRASAGLLIATGAVVLIIAIIGFVGAATENAAVLGAYIGLVALVFCGEISAGVIAIVYQDKIINQITSSMTKSIQTVTSPTTPYYSFDNTSNICSASSAGKSWDFVQTYFTCCGVGDGASSGYEISNVDLSSICKSLHLNVNRPLTCCTQVNKAFNSSHQLADSFDCSRIYNNGCADAMVTWVKKYAPVLIGIGLGIGMFQMIVVIFALCLCEHREKDNQF